MSGGKAEGNFAIRMAEKKPQRPIWPHGDWNEEKEFAKYHGTS
jgi:hypothetical protein